MAKYLFEKGNQLRKGKVPWNKDLKGEEYTKHFKDIKECGAPHKGKKPHNFINHYNYAAKEKKKRYKECVLCKGPNDAMHHRDHDENNNEDSNTIILCNPCHTFWHQNWTKRKIRN